MKTMASLPVCAVAFAAVALASCSDTTFPEAASAPAPWSLLVSPPSPNSTDERIFFASNRAQAPSGSSFHIWMMEPDGSDLTQLTFGDVNDGAPQLSPDGTTVAFHRFTSPSVNNCAEIWVKNLVTDAEIQLTFDGLASFDGAWSPDGARLAFTRSPCAGTGADIYIVDYPGGVPAPLPTSMPGQLRSNPSWSADGAYIVYGRGGGVPVELYRFTFATGLDTDLVPGVQDERNHNISPDGTAIAFNTERHSATADIYVRALPGGPEYRLTPFSGWGFPAWSPDGEKLVFGTAGNHEIWISDAADFSDRVNVIADAFVNLQPWWDELNLEITVVIDIKPGSDPNSINCNNENRNIPVAILSDEDFDATAVDHTTVTFAGASETDVDKKSGLPRRHEADVDEDGDTDLVFHFRLGDTDLTCESVDGTVSGETFDGQAIEGTDALRMIDRGGRR